MRFFVANYKCVIDLIILNYLLLYFILYIIIYFYLHLELFLTHKNGRTFCSHRGMHRVNTKAHAGMVCTSLQVCTMSPSVGHKLNMYQGDSLHICAYTCHCRFQTEQKAIDQIAFCSVNKGRCQLMSLSIVRQVLRLRSCNK